jgi:hypothetical protein
MEFKFGAVFYKDDKKYVLAEEKTKVKLKTVKGEVIEGEVTSVDSFEMGNFYVGERAIYPDDIKEIIWIEDCD